SLWRSSTPITPRRCPTIEALRRSPRPSLLPSSLLDEPAGSSSLTVISDICTPVVVPPPSVALSQNLGSSFSSSEYSWSPSTKKRTEDFTVGPFFFLTGGGDFSFFSGSRGAGAVASTGGGGGLSSSSFGW
ncbi:unnamed protein product, partial [Heterosigma akashiwo]